MTEDAERARYAPIMERLNEDSEWLAEQGIRLSQWGPEPGTGRVRVYLQRYSDDAGQFLADRYGPDIVVDSESRIWSAMGRAGDSEAEA